MHDRKLPAKPVGRHSDPHPHWKLPLRLALPLTGCSGHIATLFVICFEISTYLDETGLVEGGRHRHKSDTAINLGQTIGRGR
jgi:hypothetical protein